MAHAPQVKGWFTTEGRPGDRTFEQQLLGLDRLFTECEGKTVLDVGAGDIPMKTLDSFELQDVDFMKLDTEGMEENILRGAEATIARCWPVIVVEQKRTMASDRFGLAAKGAVTFLESLGYRMVKEMSGDFIMVPK